LDFDIAIKVKYASIFTYKFVRIDKAKDIYVVQNKTPLEDSKFEQSKKYKKLEVYEEKYIIRRDDVIAILEAKYGLNHIAIDNGELKIKYWQATKKIKHAVSFGINLSSNYGISQKQLRKINAKNVIVPYI